MTRTCRRATTSLLACVLSAQNASTIRVPVRLVSVPTLVFSPAGAVVSGLDAKDFTLLDNGIAQAVQLETENTPASIAIAVQSNAAAADYIPFVRKTGALIDSLLLGEGGRAALLSYADDVDVVKPFGAAHVSNAMKTLVVHGSNAYMVDAGLRALSLLKEEDRSRRRILLFIGQSKGTGSNAKLADLIKSAEAEGVTIHCLTLPVMGKRFVSETFSIHGKREDWGGFVASADLTKLFPALRNEKDVESGQDPFSMLARATGGMQIRFRKQEQLENGLIAMGTAIRSTYLLLYSPSNSEAGYHRLAVRVKVGADRVYSRPGYWLDRE